MEILLALLGMAVLGSMSLVGGNEESHDADLEDTDPVEEPAPANMGFLQQETSALETDPIEGAELNADVADQLQSRAFEAEHSDTPAQSQENVIYDGISDEAFGYTHNSAGIAHRFFENDAVTEDLIGSDGDDVIFAGAGSSVFTLEGSDDVQVFVPHALVGEEIAQLEDFDPSTDTLTIILEQEYVDDDDTESSNITVEAGPDGQTQMMIDGSPVAVVNAVIDSSQVAVSMDGNGEDYEDLDGLPLSNEEFENSAVKVSFLSKQSLYGV